MASRNFRTNVDLNKHQILNALLQFIGGDHASPAEGLLWWDSVAKQIAYYDGATVRRVPYTGGGTGGGDAVTLEGQAGAYYLNRTNHTGTQLASTISDLNTILAGYATDAELSAAVAALVDTAPGTLDTLNELAAALGDDPNFAATITGQIAAKAGKFSAVIGDGTTLAYNVDHNLATRAVVVSLHDATSFEEFEAQIVKSTINRVVVTFDAPAPVLNSVAVTVVG